MTKHSIKRVPITLRNASAGSGIAAVLVLTTIIVTSISWFKTAYYKKEITELRVEIQILQQRTAALQARASYESKPNNPLADYENAFPKENLRDQRIADLLMGAQGEGLNNAQTEYRLTPMKDLNLTAYRINMPLTGPYENIRNFLSKVMTNDPALALNSVKLRRKDEKTKILQAQLEFIMYMRTTDALKPTLLSKPIEPENLIGNGFRP